MFQINDFVEKQILVIDGRDGVEVNNLKFKNDNLVICKDGKEVNKVSIYKLFAIFLIGEMTISSVLIKKINGCGASIFLLNKNFEEYASIGAIAEGNYLLRERQYLFDDEFGFAKELVKNKVFNQLGLMKKVRKDYFKKKSKNAVYKELVKKIDSVENLNSLLGIEGNFSKIYFETIFGELGWWKRMPRTKIDEINLLLDIGYNLLFNYIDSLLRLHGFDTYKGIYHKLFFQRRSLSCDLIEPFRVLIDGAIVKAFNLKQFVKKDFKCIKGKYYLNFLSGRKYMMIFLSAINENKEEIFKYIKSFYFYMLNKNKNYPIAEILC